MNFAKKRDAQYELEYEKEPKKPKGGVSHPYDFVNDRELAANVGITGFTAVDTSKFSDAAAVETPRKETGLFGTPRNEDGPMDPELLKTKEDLIAQRDQVLADYDKLRTAFEEVAEE